MDWSTSALMNNSPLARRLPGQRTPPDPTIEQPNAADLTYGWHSASSSSANESEGDEGAQGGAADPTRQQEAAAALRRRRRERRVERDAALPDSESSGEGSIASFNSANDAGQTRLAFGGEGEGTAHTDGETSRKTEEEAPPPVGATLPDIDAEGFICRICFDGPGSQDEGGETLGRLIAPCRCRGTMKFVHQACLTRWRAASMRRSSVVACDQCGSPYKFRKSRFVGLATNQFLILLVSCVLFVSLIWSVGYSAEAVLRRWEDGAEMQSGSSKAGVWQSVFGEDSNGGGQILDEYEDDAYAYDYGYVSSFYWEPLSYVKLIKAAVKHVGSGRATRAVRSLVQRETDSPQEIASSKQQQQLGWFGTLVDDWKYGPGGLWEGQRPDSTHSPEKDSRSDSGDVAKEMDVGKQTATAERERYDARTASVLKQGEDPPRGSKGGAAVRGSKQDQDVETHGWWDRITLQFSLGFSLVGMFSFINLLVGISFWGPFHIGNFGLGRSFARLTGSGRRRGGGGGGGGDGGTIASVVLLFLVVVGIIRALMAVISFTTYLTKRLLTRVEDYIVEYSGEEEATGANGAIAAEVGVGGPPARPRWWLGRG